MSHRMVSLCGLLLGTAIAAGSGCFLFGGLPRVYPPAIDAAAAGSGAMQQYDTNGDGVVKGEELEKAPSLKSAIKTLDSNGDGGVSADEVTARVQQWQDLKVGRMSAGCLVTLGGKPLSDAEVTFEPEKFLGDEIQPCTGKTDEYGVANMSAPVGENLPAGAACGLYIVRISKKEGGAEKIPAKYNSETTLGVEVAPDVSESGEGTIHFDLK